VLDHDDVTRHTARAIERIRRTTTVLGGRGII